MKALELPDSRHLRAVRWEIYAAAKKREAASIIAAAILQMDPDVMARWVHRSCGLFSPRPRSEWPQTLRIVSGNRRDSRRRMAAAAGDRDLGL